MCEKSYFLRPLQEKDAGYMLEWLHDRTVTGHLQLDGADSTLADALRFIQAAQNESIDLHRAVVDLCDTYLGTVSLKKIDLDKREAEYAIAMRASAMGTGAALSATQDILKIAFHELKLRRVYLNVLRENQRAIHFYNKCGFQYTHQSELVLRRERRVLLWYEQEDKGDI